jgi:hypothetical protein
MNENEINKFIHKQNKEKESIENEKKLKLEKKIKIRNQEFSRISVEKENGNNVLKINPVKLTAFFYTTTTSSIYFFYILVMPLLFFFLTFFIFAVFKLPLNWYMFIVVIGLTNLLFFILYRIFISIVWPSITFTIVKDKFVVKIKGAKSITCAGKISDTKCKLTYNEIVYAGWGECIFYTEDCRTDINFISFDDVDLIKKFIRENNISKY